MSGGSVRFCGSGDGEPPAHRALQVEGAGFLLQDLDRSGPSGTGLAGLCGANLWLALWSTGRQPLVLSVRMRKLRPRNEVQGHTDPDHAESIQSAHPGLGPPPAVNGADQRCTHTWGVRMAAWVSPPPRAPSSPQRHHQPPDLRAAPQRSAAAVGHRGPREPDRLPGPAQARCCRPGRRSLGDRSWRHRAREQDLAAGGLGPGGAVCLPCAGAEPLHSWAPL